MAFGWTLLIITKLQNYKNYGLQITVFSWIRLTLFYLFNLTFQIPYWFSWLSLLRFVDYHSWLCWRCSCFRWRFSALVDFDRIRGALAIAKISPPGYCLLALPLLRVYLCLSPYVGQSAGTALDGKNCRGASYSLLTKAPWQFFPSKLEEWEFCPA